MFKKLIAVMTAAAMAFSSALIVSADGENEKVEISFRVGESVLSINGAPVEVETPYVAGEGTTLVPLRVITEAFGAQVDWDNDTETVTLTYPGVKILLQIGNIVAQVNDHSETLLEAPVLSPNDFTMVPLRFISETFGADVSYDDATEAILVTKEAIGGNTVTGATDMVRTGDSYYDWSIDTPKQMTMTERREDGLFTEFSADDESRFYISIYNWEEDELIPFDEEFANIQNSFSGYTLAEAEKLTDKSGNKYMHFQAKKGSELIDYREYYTSGNRTFDVVSMIKDSSSDTKDMILALADSFVIGKINDQTYDLSSVSDSLREIKSDTYGVTFKVPADMVKDEDSADNEFHFARRDSNSRASVRLGIFSKSEEVTAKKLAELDYENNKNNLNPEFLTATSEPKKMSDGSYRYTLTISGSSADDHYMIDSFFEKGDYVYNMSVNVDTPEEANEAEEILASLKADELDAAKVGKLLRNYPDRNTLTTKTLNGYTFSLPVSWTSALDMDTNVSYMDVFSGSMINVSVTDDNDITPSSLSTVATNFKEYSMSSRRDNEMLGGVEYETINGERYARVRYKSKNQDGSVFYVTTYIRTVTRAVIMFSLFEEDVYYHKDGNETLLNALNSLTKK